MLKKFKISNYKQFGELELDFTEVRDYSFAETNVTPDKLLMKSALLYGDASCGKTNLGYALLDAAWVYLKPNEEQDPNMHVRLYVIDETSIRDEAGAAASFAQLREAAQEDPANLGAYSFEVLLSGWPYGSSWDGERTNGYCEPEDVGGSIARSRIWLFEDAVDLR